MTAVLIPTGSEAEWLEARRQGITASEIAVVMGLSPYSSPYKLYHQKLGILAPDDDNPAMERGRELEPGIARKFAELHPEFIVDGNGRELFASAERPWQLATPDRMLVSYDIEQDTGATIPIDDVAVLECKSDGGDDGWGEPGTDEIPVAYRCQALWQCRVMGVGRAIIACRRIRDWRLLEYEITLDDAALDDLALMEGEALGFLDRIARGREPEVDWRPSTADALKRLHPSLEDTGITISRTLAGQYRAACAAVKRAEKRKALAENRIRARLGSGRQVLDPSGALVATRQVYEVKAHTRKASTVNKLVPAKGKKETPE